jgi:two-component system phosphate regulon response regulator OmpR
MNDAAQIVVVDDEPEVREMIEEYLTGQGFAVTVAANGAELRCVLAEQSPDLVILDLRMPGEDGLSLARYVRENHSAGIIMVTGAGTVIDRVVGLEVGADDYIAKPFDPRELLARIRSVLRRTDARRQPQQAPEKTRVSEASETVRIGRCILDLNAHTLVTVDGEDVAMTSMEFDLLKAFAENPNRVLSRDRLLDLAHNRDWDPYDRSIDIRITRIRRKIEPDPAKPQTIKTVRGSGYIFVPAAHN